MVNDPAAVRLGKKRAALAKRTDENAMVELGKRGGLAAAGNLTDAQRSARAKKAAAARWGKGKRKPNA